MKSRSLLLVAAVAATLRLCPSTGAVSVGGLNVHGSLSLAGSSTTEYDFIGDTRNRLALNSSEFTLNASRRFQGGFLAGAQLYAYDLGGYRAVQLDWASLSYAFSEKLSIRVGRNKLPFGLHNDAQDLDAVRTFAHLPELFYTRTLRPITSAYDGAALQGTIAAGRFGSFDYHAAAGRVGSFTDRTLLLDNFSNYIRWKKWSPRTIYIGSLFWNTPIEGLKLGYSWNHWPKTEINGHLDRSANLRGGDYAFTQQFGPGVWDARLAGTPARFHDVPVTFRAWSAELTRGRLVLAAELRQQHIDAVRFVPALGLVSPVQVPLQRTRNYYVSATWQLTERVGTGLAYSYADADTTARSTPDWTTVTRVWSPVISFAPRPWLLLKAQYSWFDGTSLIGGVSNGVATPHRRWGMLTLKSTVSF